MNQPHKPFPKSSFCWSLAIPPIASFLFLISGIAMKSWAVYAASSFLVFTLIFLCWVVAIFILSERLAGFHLALCILGYLWGELIVCGSLFLLGWWALHFLK